MATSKDLLNNTLTNKFDMGRFQEFIVQFFNNSKIIDTKNKRQDYWNWTEYSYYINGFFHVAEYIDPNRKKIAIFAVELKKGKSLEKARSKQRNFIADRIKNSNYDGAITAFYSEDAKENKWRLSFVRLDYEFLKGKVKTNFTPAKRYSYLVGADEPCHTAMQQLLPILEEENFNPTLDKIEEAFSVEKVTKQFFEKYREKYFEIKEYLITNNIFIEEASRCIKTDNDKDIEKFTEQFAKKLMGQIAFMYFLQKKGWMGVNAIPQTITESQFKNLYFYNALSKKFANDLYKKVGENEYRIVPSVLKSLSEDEELAVASSLKGKAWGDGPKDFVRKLYDDAVKNNKFYFDDYLEPLFYEALNEKRPANNYFTKLHCRIPFLNGGLFEPYYDWKNNRFSIPNHIFSNKDTKGERDADGILDIFDRYNFTMNEDEPLEKEVAVDPEMLGKIFENLLDAKDRKSKGAFYTPREIVHYMCQESLINYLVNTVETPYEDTKDFILYGEIMKDEDCSREVKQGIANMLIPESIYAKLNDIDKALADVRVADPAVGSGAFPMGMINEIVKARDVITDYRAREIELDGKKKGISDKQIAFLKANEHNLRNLYTLKKEAMFNSIYAVDIEPSAVDIAKLRLWLSLVVEFEVSADEPNPPTLPNLDCHIICGNSLIDEFEGVQLFDPSILNSFGDLISSSYSGLFERLYELERKFFYAQNHSEKYEYRNKIEEIKLSIMQSALAGCSNETKERFLATRNMPSKPYTLWQLEFSKVFKEKGGFDIVIGNPPYIKIQHISSNESICLKKKYGSANGKYDMYVLFDELSYHLIHKKGIASFIQPHRFLIADYGKALRSFIKSNKYLSKVVNFGISQIFDTATTYTGIFFFTKNSPNIQYADCDSNNFYKIQFSENKYELLRDVWTFKDNKIQEILNKIYNQKYKFYDIFEGIYQGAITLGDDIFVLKGDYKGDFFEGYSNALKDNVLIEKEIVKPLLKGENIRRYKSLQSNIFILYPHYIRNGKTQPYDEETIKAKFPLFYGYILKFKDYLLEKKIKYKTNPDYWYSLHRAREKKLFESLKIITPQLQNYPNFTIDNENFYPDAGGYMLVAKDNSFANILPYLAILNSKLFWFFIKNTSTSFRGNYYYFKTQYIEPFVFPNINNEDFIRLQLLVEDIYNSANGNFQKERDIDLLVYKLYELTDEEIKIIESNK